MTDAALRSWFGPRTRGTRCARASPGQGLVEYALIIALVSLAAVAALGFLSGKINNLFSKAGNVLNNVKP